MNEPRVSRYASKFGRTMVECTCGIVFSERHSPIRFIERHYRHMEAATARPRKDRPKE